MHPENISLIIGMIIVYTIYNLIRHKEKNSSTNKISNTFFIIGMTTVGIISYGVSKLPIKEVKMILDGVVFGIGILLICVIYIIIRGKDASKYITKQIELHETIVFPHPQKTYTRSNRFFTISIVMLAIIDIIISIFFGG
jgi:hypothetical protein